MRTIDMTPTWGQVGNIYHRFALSGERKALEKLHPEIAKAFAAAQALTVIKNELPPALAEKVDAIMRDELAKQGTTPAMPRSAAEDHSDAGKAGIPVNQRDEE